MPFGEFVSAAQYFLQSQAELVTEKFGSYASADVQCLEETRYYDHLD